MKLNLKDENYILYEQVGLELLIIMDDHDHVFHEVQAQHSLNRTK